MDFYTVRKEILSKNISVKELIADFFLKIANKNPSINAYTCETIDIANEQANKIDQSIQNGEQLPPLAGIPIAIKDNICTKDVITSCSSKML